jgi:serine/threonine protein kinase
MNRYKVTKQLGDGTYGTVLKGQNRQTGEFVSLILAAAAGSCCLPCIISICGIDGNKENEEEILFVGGMYAAARSEGASSCAY